jgi:transcriptional regulator with XRE-family HTH domain
MKTLKEFGKNVRKIRIIKGLSQKQLGAKSSLNHNYIGAVERGERNLSLKSIQKIAQGLDVEIYTLFDF